VLSEIFYPGWKATVDGEEAEVLRANWSLRAVALRGGNHSVELRFAPASFRTGTAITVITLAVCAVLLVLIARRNGARATLSFV
jgi:uncharacterized membrane protein YfhO